MPSFDDTIQEYYERRIGTLARIKTRSLGADTLTLTALQVLVYAQLEGGIKDLAGCLIKDINARRLCIGEVNPKLLKWRNPSDLDQFKSLLDFDIVASSSPFALLLQQKVEVKALNRRHELNQMDSAALESVYAGLGLNLAQIDLTRAQIDEIVDERNEAAHYGVVSDTTSILIEQQLRANATLVEDILTDMSLQLLDFFEKGLHRRVPLAAGEQTKAATFES